MKKTKQIGILEYATKIDPSYFRLKTDDPNREISRQAIKYRIKKGMELPEVIKYTRVGKVHVLTVDANF